MSHQQKGFELKIQNEPIIIMDATFCPKYSCGKIAKTKNVHINVSDIINSTAINSFTKLKVIRW